MKTTHITKKQAMDSRRWYLVDARGKTLGRLAADLARILQGKHRPDYSPHVDCGDYVVVINADKFVLTGKKRETKVYRHHSGYPGGLKERTLVQMLEKRADSVLRLAVKRMMPKTKLGKQMLTKLKTYGGEDHPHAAQNPKVLEDTRKLPIEERN